MSPRGNAVAQAGPDYRRVSSGGGGERHQCTNKRAKKKRIREGPDLECVHLVGNQRVTTPRIRKKKHTDWGVKRDEKRNLEETRSCENKKGEDSQQRSIGGAGDTCAERTATNTSNEKRQGSASRLSNNDWTTGRIAGELKEEGKP